jgi:iron complex transport system ATP-binding protein
MSAESSGILSTHDIGVEVPGRQLVDALNVSFARGEFVAVLGRNGAGKTLTLSTLAGLREPGRGHVRIDDTDISTLKRQNIAKRLALLPQSVDDIFPSSVLETAMIGRHPHIGRLRWESGEDNEITLAALRTMNVEDLAVRNVLTLSGGERRRVAVAQILAQAPEIYLLDEPTNHLDPQHQLDVLNVFREKADSGACVIASLHDVNLAARFADRCLLLYGDGQWEIGRCEDILTESRLEALFGTTMEAVDWRGTRIFIATGSAMPSAQGATRR